jgi:hypothetical protein
MSSIIRADQWQNSNGVAYNSVLQVVSTTKTDTYTATSSTYVDITGLSATITPKFSTSKILVMVSMVATGQSAATVAHFQLARSGTAIGIGDAGGASQVRGTSYARDSDRPMSISMTFLDSPATTSSVIYSVQQRNEGAYAVYVNRSQTDSNNTYYGRSSSTITVMEIAQ